MPISEKVLYFHSEIYNWSDKFRNQKAELFVEQFAAKSGNLTPFLHHWSVKSGDLTLFLRHWLFRIKAVPNDQHGLVSAGDLAMLGHRCGWDRQTDRQTDRHTIRQTDTHTHTIKVYRTTSAVRSVAGSLASLGQRRFLV